MENYRTSTALLSSFWDQVFKTRHQLSGHHKQIHHEETTNPQMKETKRIKKPEDNPVCFNTKATSKKDSS